MMFNKRHLLKNVDLNSLGDTERDTRELCSNLINYMVETHGKECINILTDKTGLCRQTIINLMELNGEFGPLLRTSDKIFQAFDIEIHGKVKDIKELSKKLKLVA